MTPPLTQQLEALVQRDHVCQIFQTRNELVDAVVPFLVQGIQRGERSILLAAQDVLESVRARLGGFDGSEAGGAYLLLDRPNAGMRAGRLRPDGMSEFLHGLETDAVAAGYSGLRVCGEAGWVLGEDVSPGEVLEYEIEINRLLPPTRSSLLCCYDRTRFDGAVIHDVMRTHPLVILNETLCPNPYFEPPELFSEPSLSPTSDEFKRRRVGWWLECLRKAQATEFRKQRAEDSVRHFVEAERTRADRFRLIGEELPYIVWMARPDGEIDFLNRRGEEVLGGPQSLIHGDGWLDALHPDDVGNAKRNWKAAVRSAAFYQTELRIRQGDGSYRWYLSQAFPIRGSRGDIERWIGTLTDIDARKQMEESLRLRDRAMQAVSQGILITDPNLPDNPIIYCSPSFERMTKYSADEVIGRNCRFLQGPATDPEAASRLNAAIRHKRPCTVELLNYRKDGTTFWNELSISPVWDEKGRLTHFIGVQADVTERRKLEEQLRQAQKMETIGQLAGGIAHDFNNLLTIIIGYSDVLIDSVPKDAAIHNLLEEIQRAVERSATAVRQILAFGRKQILSPRLLEINDIVRDTESILRHTIGEDVLLESDLYAMLWPIKADPGQIQQVLMNLVVNARDAMPQGGTLSIRTYNRTVNRTNHAEHPAVETGEFVVLSVADTGIGMNEEVRERMFEPFFTTKEVGRGTGLGLAVVDQIVRDCAGAIEVESEPGRGSTFRILFPRVELSKTAPPQTTARPGPGIGTETILVVEDEDAVRSLIQHFLADRGYRVLAARNSEEAFEICINDHSSIQLLLMDVVMPGLGGAALAERLTALHPEMKVLFMSGYTDDAVLRYGVQQEKMEFLPKPFSPVALAQKVREVLS